MHNFLRQTAVMLRINLLLLHLSALCLCARETAQVTTKYGQLEGMRMDLEDGRNVDVFLGIPYAKPPIGKLRFQKPQLPQSWTGVRKAVEFGPICQQLSLKHPKEEDCLSLNVIAPAWTPQQFSAFPVMFWIHGGGYLFGSSVEYGYEGLAKGLVSKGVVVVTINYRLGVFGFLSTGDDVCPGNLGLWDQFQALQWVKQNIASFGGDPDQITVFGESAGGSSTDLLTLSPYSRDLFDKAIPMSGSKTTSWAIGAKTVHFTKKTAENADCATESSEEMISCLRDKTPDQILQAVGNGGIVADAPLKFQFAPIIDGDFLPYDLHRLRKEAPKKTVILGTCQVEGIVLSILLRLSKFSVGPNFGEHMFGEFFAETLPSTKYKNADILHLVGKHQYLSDGNANNATFLLYKYCELFGDYTTVVPIHTDQKEMLENDWTVYLYSYEYASPLSYFPEIPLKVPSHASELPLLFGEAVFGQPINLTIEDKQVQDRFLSLWAQFATTGNPNNGVKHDEWESSDLESIDKYLRISTDMTMKRNYHQSSINFWTHLISEIEKFEPIAKKSHEK